MMKLFVEFYFEIYDEEEDIEFGVLEVCSYVWDVDNILCNIDLVDFDGLEEDEEE